MEWVQSIFDLWLFDWVLKGEASSALQEGIIAWESFRVILFLWNWREHKFGELNSSREMEMDRKDSCSHTGPFFPSDTSFQSFLPHQFPWTGNVFLERQWVGSSNSPKPQPGRSNHIPLGKMSVFGLFLNSAHELTHSSHCRAVRVERC
jgi:hypothetical protein